jgi:hypothetical protein
MRYAGNVKLDHFQAVVQFDSLREFYLEMLTQVVAEVHIWRI